MNRRNFIQAAPLTLSILPCLPESAAKEDAFKAELYRRFENLPDYLKGGALKMADVVRLLETSEPPRIECISVELCEVLYAKV